jgi:hypothetical protein
MLNPIVRHQENKKEKIEMLKRILIVIAVFAFCNVLPGNVYGRLPALEITGDSPPLFGFAAAAPTLSCTVTYSNYTIVASSYTLGGGTTHEVRHIALGSAVLGGSNCPVAGRTFATREAVSYIWEYGDGSSEARVRGRFASAWDLNNDGNFGDSVFKGKVDGQVRIDGEIHAGIVTIKALGPRGSKLALSERFQTNASPENLYLNVSDILAIWDLDNDG